MSMIRKFLMKCFICFFALPACASDGQIAEANNIDIWYETFGCEKDPALLLVMGGFCQGILWPTEFCEKLANKGFYVIRYDHRDTGFSTCFDFEKNPYDLLDMAKDAIGLLDALEIKKAHIVGLSMGGPIAELMAVHFKERVSTITLMATSCDMRPMSLAYDKQYPEDITLSRPKKVYLDWMHQFMESTAKTEAEKLEERVVCWEILNGTVVPFERERYREIHQEFLSRLKHPESLPNHLPAIKNSFEMIQTAPHQVSVPTLIFHGSEDTIFPPDHGVALSNAIKRSKFIQVHGFGHVPNCHFYDLFISNIKEHTQSN